MDKYDYGMFLVAFDRLVDIQMAMVTHHRRNLRRAVKKATESIPREATKVESKGKPSVALTEAEIRQAKANPFLQMDLGYIPVETLVKLRKAGKRNLEKERIVECSYRFLEDEGIEFLKSFKEGYSRLLELKKDNSCRDRFLKKSIRQLLFGYRTTGNLKWAMK